jgi:hypothetical protein
MADPKTIAATQVIRLPMRAAEIASVRVLDTDLIVILKSGQRVTIRDGAMRAMIDTNLRIAFADAEILAADLLKQVGTVQADALSDLSVASKDAADADASKTPDANAPGKPLDVLTKQQTQIELLSPQPETFSSNIEGKLTQIIQPDATSQAPAAAKSGFLANISLAWLALGAAALNSKPDPTPTTDVERTTPVWSSPKSSSTAMPAPTTSTKPWVQAKTSTLSSWPQASSPQAPPASRSTSTRSPPSRS